MGYGTFLPQTHRCASDALQVTVRLPKRRAASAEERPSTKKARKTCFGRKHFWSRGYCVTTVRLDEQMITAYIKNPDDLDRREDLFNQ